jgi:large subunit ribosomal protein L35
MKLKTNKSMAKRVKTSGTGKLMRSKAAISHLLSHKSNRVKVPLEISQSDRAGVKKLCPYL